MIFHNIVEHFQIRYQQKQKEEMERKRNEFIGTRPPVTPLDLNDNNKIQIGNGKVIFSPSFDKLNIREEEKKNQKQNKSYTI